MPIRRGLAIHERDTVGNSIQLIREVGYFQEADFLDRQLEINQINVDDDLYFSDTLAYSLTSLLRSGIYLNSRLLSFDEEIIMRCDGRIVLVSSTLLHEAKHAQQFGDFAAYGTEINFLKILLQRFDDIFMNCLAGQVKQIQEQLEERLQNASELRQQHIREY